MPKVISGTERWGATVLSAPGTGHFNRVGTSTPRLSGATTAQDPEITFGNCSFRDWSYDPENIYGKRHRRNLRSQISDYWPHSQIDSTYAAEPSRSHPSSCACSFNC